MRTGAVADLRRWRYGVALLVAGALLYAVSPATVVEAQVGLDPNPPVEAVPEADCGPGSNPETGLQGQTPMAERRSGATTTNPAKCNLELVGSYAHGEGSSWQFAWYDDCGYYGTLDNPARVTENGAVVVDVSDPANPVGTAVLDTPAVNDPHEALKVNQARGLLAAVDLNGPGFDVYDVSKDCAQPELLASVDIPGRQGHEGEWAPDGRTYWGSQLSGTYYAIDVTDPTDPKEIASYSPGTTIHGLSISDDGMRGYFTTLAPAGVVIGDLRDIQLRRPNARVREISRITWPDGTLAQHTIPVTYDGKPYLINVDEGGRGAARIIDISDETLPVVVSKLKLEVHLPQNEPHVREEWGTQAIFVYDGHYCTEDRREDPTLLACGYFESGIRVFDIRDPENPREIAYYKPPAITDRPLPASSHGGGTADRCAAAIRIVPPTVDPETGRERAAQLWTQCQDNEFMVLEFTNGVWPFPEG